MLAYITGTVDQELLLRNEYLAAENRILRAQITGRLLLSDAEKAALAEIAHGLGRKAWKNWRLWRGRIRCWPGTESSSPTSSTDRSFAKFRGRPRVDEETERLVVRMAKENPGWGNFERFLADLCSTPIWWRRAEFFIGSDSSRFFERHNFKSWR